ncbi:hypothetical protein K461DRAFT_268623 [Myriangium duriaei CBS 260.36]|uniref:Zn(2)-C6 fungal-type domain-containing protein n=1 Tax=Myriangium duriaei CBS 260.36 TaxID=1168546 RepID=A0A9P4J3S4_9PEZI|nr:hypothetical protein K461DRAFT_268623 [Myriangium duriaei CBS 260.36]
MDETRTPQPSGPSLATPQSPSTVGSSPGIQSGSGRRSKVAKSKNRSVACKPCRKRKVKCSGGHPCPNCAQAGYADECVYNPRDRKVRISQQYIDSLVRENERLAARSTSAIPEPPATIQDEEDARNPLLEDRPWFLHVNSLDMPAHIGEAADTAFATKFRQSLSSRQVNHILRTQYYPDDLLLSLSYAECPWPSPSRARFLVTAALRHVTPCFYMINEKDILNKLSLFSRDPTTLDISSTYKLWSLFALGELYTSRGYGREMIRFPGVNYFAQATRTLSVPSERPRIDSVETRLLLSVYYFALNRRHSAGLCASSAIRISTVLGMHLNIAESDYDSPAVRQHRIRIWWTAYICDRMWTTKTGQPVTIEEDRIEVELPSDERLSEAERASLGNTAVLKCSIELARLSARTINALYSRRKLSMPFSHRVQNILRDLRNWSQNLPPDLCITSDSEGLTSQTPSVLYLHLSFNQCIILATRPILLRTFQMFKRAAGDQRRFQTSMPPAVRGLAETCMQCARHSYRLLSASWIDGSFATFDYFNTQYLFSATSILAISSVLPSSQQQEDRDSFETAVHLLEQLRDSGSFAAKDYCAHLSAVKENLAEYEASLVSTELTRHGADQSANGLTGMTTGEMALSDPFILDFLAQPDLDVSFIDPSIYDGQLADPNWPMTPDLVG